MTKKKVKETRLTTESGEVPAIIEADPDPPTVTGMTKEEFEARVTEAVIQAPGGQHRTKVAILGFTDTWKMAPFNDPEFEVWGLNELYQFIPRWDRWFEIHDRKIYENDRNRVSDHIVKLRAMTCPVYMHQHWDDIPASVPYPLQEMSRMFPNPCPEALPYFNNSISYMLALAIAEGFQEIHVYGVDMAHDSEYNSQRPSCEYLLGIAQGRGIKLYIPSEADLLKLLFLYGFQQETAMAFDRELAEKETDMQNKLNQANGQLQAVIEQRAQFGGALQHIQHMRTNWRSLHSGANAPT